MERHSSVHAHNTRVVGLQSLPDIGMLSISESHAKLHSAGGFLHWSCSDDVRITSSLCDSPGAVTRPLRLRFSRTMDGSAAPTVVSQRPRTAATRDEA